MIAVLRGFISFLFCRKEVRHSEVSKTAGFLTKYLRFNNTLLYIIKNRGRADNN